MMTLQAECLGLLNMIKLDFRLQSIRSALLWRNFSKIRRFLFV